MGAILLRQDHYLQFESLKHIREDSERGYDMEISYCKAPPWSFDRYSVPQFSMEMPCPEPLILKYSQQNNCYSHRFCPPKHDNLIMTTTIHLYPTWLRGIRRLAELPVEERFEHAGPVAKAKLKGEMLIIHLAFMIRVFLCVWDCPLCPHIHLGDEIVSKCVAKLAMKMPKSSLKDEISCRQCHTDIKINIFDYEMPTPPSRPGRDRPVIKIYVVRSLGSIRSAADPQWIHQLTFETPSVGFG